jgi:uncharacterized protein YndB with AHSA1/START domain
MNSTIANDTLVKEIVIRAPAERIFEALTNPDQRLRRWQGPTEIETRELCAGDVSGFFSR